MCITCEDTGYAKVWRPYWLSDSASPSGVVWADNVGLEPCHCRAWFNSSQPINRYVNSGMKPE